MKLLLILIIAISCSSNIKKEKINTLNNSDNLNKEIFINDTLIKIGRIITEIKKPKGTIKGSILMLPGWNFSKNSWCENSTFCNQALDSGYQLIMPEMLKSLYASNVSNCTRKDWTMYPQLLDLIDTFIPFLIQFNIINSVQNNFIVGLSTGARGAFQLIINNDSLFKAIAVLSGDYNQLLTPNDNLIFGFYGKFNSRNWKEIDNPFYNLKKTKTNIYFGHGMKDNIVSFKQSLLFYNKIKNEKLCSNVYLKLNPNGFS